MDKQQFKEIEEFLLSYNQKRREVEMLKAIIKNYSGVDIIDEIESRSLSHPAECDNIGAGRNNSISQKTADIALSIENYSLEVGKEKENIISKIKSLQIQIDIIKAFSNNLSEVNAIIFNGKFINDTSLNFKEMLDLVNEKLNKQYYSTTSIRKRYVNLVKEFGNLYLNIEYNDTCTRIICKQ